MIATLPRFIVRMVGAGLLTMAFGDVPPARLRSIHGLGAAWGSLKSAQPAGRRCAIR